MRGIYGVVHYSVTNRTKSLRRPLFSKGLFFNVAHAVLKQLNQSEFNIMKPTPGVGKRRASQSRVVLDLFLLLETVAQFSALSTLMCLRRIVFYQVFAFFPGWIRRGFQIMRQRAEKSKGWDIRWPPFFCQRLSPMGLTQPCRYRAALWVKLPAFTKGWRLFAAIWPGCCGVF